MNIAIVSSFKHHVECIGFMLESLCNISNSEKYNVTLFVPGNTYGYTEYFERIYEGKFSIEHISKLNKYRKQIDVYIKISSDMTPVYQPVFGSF